MEKTFTLGNKTYVYDFNLLSVEQAELAREAGEFKLHQQQSMPDSFRQVTKSRGTDFLSIIMGYLLREKVGTEVFAFNRDKAELEVELFVKNLPVNELENLRACVQDFFTGISSTETGNKLLMKDRKPNGTEMLSTMLRMIMPADSNAIAG